MPPTKPSIPVRNPYDQVRLDLSQPNKTLQRAIPTVAGGNAQPQAPKQTRSYSQIVQAGPTRLLFTVENWSTVRLTLRSAGPIAVGTASDLMPLTSGKGILLVTDEPYVTVVPGGTRIYAAAGAINRLNVTIEPVPWLEQIALQLEQIRGAVVGSAEVIRGAIAGLFRRP